MLRAIHRRLTAGFLTGLLSLAATAGGVVDPAPFFKHQEFGELKLSPSGRYLGGLVPAGGRLGLVVVDLDANKTTVAAAYADADVRTFEWVNDQRLVYSVMDLKMGLGEQRGGGLFAINRDGTEPRTLGETFKTQEDRRPAMYHVTQLHSTLHDGSDDILVTTIDVDAHSVRSPDIYRVNTRTGRRALKSFERPGDVWQWVADRKGEVRALVAVENDTIYRIFWRTDESAKWVQIGEYRRDEQGFIPIAFDGDGTLLVTSNVGRDAREIRKFNPLTKTLGEVVAAHPRADLAGGLRYDWSKNRIVGVAFEGELPGTVWFDDDWARLQTMVDAALPDHVNVVSRGTAPRALVYSYSDADPGRYYLLDLERRRLTLFGARRKDIQPEAMPSRQAIRYAARDGLEIPAELTLPRGVEAKGLPLVLYVHGGPWSRGAHWRWDDEAAYLASLGYAVLQPDFRGSAGWGAKLLRAGWKQWGRAMQDDLNDGVDWLAQQGTIDAKRVCIMGASYGGYAVMMGLARDPERWRCGINYVGVTDINLMFDVTWSDFAYSDYIKYSAKDMIGDPDKDAAMLKAASPLANASRIKAPVLMAYGAQDYRVPLVHGEKMRDALRASGATVEWVVYREEGHGFWLESNNFDFHDRVAKFLAKYNPAN